MGSGNGEPLDSSLLDILSSVLPKVEYTVVEPRADALEEFKNNQVESKVQNVQFQWFLGTFHEYQNQEWPKQKEQFHLIHLVA